MSITKEQAATWFETMHPPGPAVREMYRMAAKALRPVNREQVEKSWRGEWIDTRKSGKDVPTCMCSRCTRVVVGLESKFCPDCGSPMTDEAVETVMERMEALDNETQ